MHLRWMRQAAVSVVVVAVLFLAGWKLTHSTTWTFSGRIVDGQTLQGIAGASVTLEEPGISRQYKTDLSGTYRMTEPQPKPADITLKFERVVYKPEEMRFSTEKIRMTGRCSSCLTLDTGSMNRCLSPADNNT
jgi:hypothetical protein